MPHEAFPIVKKSDGFDREEVADKIVATFDLIAAHSGKLVTVITCIEQEYTVQSGGTPSNITYIVADFKEPFDRNEHGDLFKVNAAHDPYEFEINE